MKIGLLYGSTSGRTRVAAETIRRELDLWGEPERLDVCALDVAHQDLDCLEGFDLLLVGAPTWSVGELQADWATRFPGLDAVDLSGTRVALFGLGDQRGYADTFVDAMGILRSKLAERGADVGYGAWSTEGYSFRRSRALMTGGQFCGLALDDDNQPQLTAPRIRRWCSQLCAELGLASDRAA
jgi:flavodoxin I